MSAATILLSPFWWSLGDIPEIYQWVIAIRDCARPVPGIVCLVVAGLFLIQGFRYLAKVRPARAGADSPRRRRWLWGVALTDFILTVSWLALLGLELAYPEAKQPAAPKPSLVETRL